MKSYSNTNVTCKALTIRKETSLTIIHKFTYTTIRISAKAILGAIALTLLNLVI